MLVATIISQYDAGMVIGYHVILSAYGFWLPNDPRGSWSTEVWARHLRRFGRATRVETRRSVADHDHDRAQRLEAKQTLKYPAVHFSGMQTRAIGRGFAKAVGDLRLKVYACAIMPDHVHLVTGRHARDVEYVAGFLKRVGTRRLNAEGRHPLQKHRRPDGRIPSPWGDDGWFVYLNTPDEMLQRIRYVEMNPVKEGLPLQRWPFVVPYDG